jgi:hypothetical protein
MQTAAAPTRKLARYDATDMDDDSLKITVWLPGPRSGADVIFVLQLETDLITQLRRERVIIDPHRSTPSQGTPIEIDLVRPNALNLMAIPRDHFLVLD